MQDAYERHRGVPLALWQPSDQLEEQPPDHDKRAMMVKKKDNRSRTGLYMRLLIGTKPVVDLLYLYDIVNDTCPLKEKDKNIVRKKVGPSQEEPSIIWSP